MSNYKPRSLVKGTNQLTAPNWCNIEPQAHLLAVNLHRHAGRIHHQFPGPPLRRDLRVGAATGPGRFPQEGPGLWAITLPNRAPGPVRSQDRLAHIRGRGPHHHRDLSVVGVCQPPESRGVSGAREAPGRREAPAPTSVDRRFTGLNTVLRFTPSVSMITRPPSVISTYRLWLSIRSMPSRGATPTASMSMYRGRPSRTTVALWTLKATTVPSARADRLRITKGNSNSAASSGGKARLPLHPVSITASISRSRSSGPRTGRLTTASRKPFTTPSITWLSTGNCHRRCATSGGPPAPTRHRRPGIGHADAPLRQGRYRRWRSPRCPRRWRRTRHDGPPENGQQKSNCV